MKCTQCGAELEPGDRFCGHCGSPQSQLAPRFADTEGRFALLRARYQAGELDDTAFDAALQELVIEDEADGYWMLGAESGSWYWHDGRQWVRRDPPLVAASGQPVPPHGPSPPVGRPARPIGITQPTSIKDPAGKSPRRKWIAASAGGIVIAAVVTVGVLFATGVLPGGSGQTRSAAGSLPTASTRAPTGSLPPTKKPSPPTSPTRPTSTPAASILYENDFSKSFNPIVQEEGEVRWQAGELVLLATKAGRAFVTPFKGSDCGDFHLEVVARPIVLQVDGVYGVLFRLDPDALDRSGYWFQIRGDDTCKVCKRLADGTLDCFNDPQPCPVTPDGETLIEIDAVGAVLGFSVNGTFLFSVVDESYSSGRIALVAGNTGQTTGTEVAFDDLLVVEP
jgi:hypothetical protein